jgi:hypothetical protein
LGEKLDFLQIAILDEGSQGKNRVEILVLKTSSKYIKTILLIERIDSIYFLDLKMEVIRQNTIPKFLFSRNFDKNIVFSCLSLFDCYIFGFIFLSLLILLVQGYQMKLYFAAQNMVQSNKHSAWIDCPSSQLDGVNRLGLQSVKFFLSLSL